jgi:hypothetical protein
MAMIGIYHIFRQTHIFTPFLFVDAIMLIITVPTCGLPTHLRQLKVSCRGPYVQTGLGSESLSWQTELDFISI